MLAASDMADMIAAATLGSADKENWTQLWTSGGLIRVCSVCVYFDCGLQLI